MTVSARTYRWLLVFACLLFVAQALPLLSYRWVEDESWYSSTGYTLMHEGVVRNAVFPPTDLESVADTRPLAMPATLALTMKSLGVDSASTRVPGFLACLAAIPLVFWLGCLCGSREAGIVAALLLSVDNSLFLAARIVRPEAFVTFFGLLAVTLYFLSRRRDSVAIAVLSGLSVGVALNYHVNGLAVAASLGLLLIGEFGFSIWRQKRAWAVATGIMATMVPFFLWLQSDPARLTSFHYLYGRGNALTAADVFRWEMLRYTDYLGMSNARLSLIPYPIPLRLHVVLLFLACLGLLAWKRRVMFWSILALIVPSLLLWTREVNPSARFFAILAPYLVLAVGLAFTLLPHGPWRRVLAAWCLLVFVSQAAGNALILRQSRNADYAGVSRKLRSLIPSDSRVYGAITFFLALHDRTYYAWNHTPFGYAINDLHVNYLILNDRVLVHGSGFGRDDWREVREDAAAFVPNHADLVGRVQDPFYGDLEVYRVRPAQTSPN